MTTEKPKIKLFACYERNFCNRWVITVYHGEKPGKSSNSDDKVRSDTWFEVPDHMINIDGTPSFKQIEAVFPAPSSAPTLVD